MYPYPLSNKERILTYAKKGLIIQQMFPIYITLHLWGFYYVLRQSTLLTTSLHDMRQKNSVLDLGS